MICKIINIILPRILSQIINRLKSGVKIHARFNRKIKNTLYILHNYTRLKIRKYVFINLKF